MQVPATDPQHPSPLANWLRNPVILCLLLAGMAVALYWPVYGFDCVSYDDRGYFERNPQVLAGLSWDGITWAFTTGAADNWHPLTWLSLMFDVSFWTSTSPSGPHVSNLIYHALNGALLFLVLRRLTGAYWRSALVAGLFAVHPLNVESVAWISERKNVLSTLFWLLTLLAYARYASYAGASPAHDTRDSQRRLFYGLTVGCFALGLMCKPMLVTLPCVLLLLDHWPLQRWRMDLRADWRQRLPGLLTEKVPLFLLAAAVSIVTVLVQDKAVEYGERYTMGERLENAFVAYARYLGKAVWPENLTVFYPHPGHWPAADYLAAALFLVVASVAAWHAWGRRPFVSVGWFWFLGTLVPVIGLVQVGAQAMADRYAYVPLIGIFILLSWGAASLVTHWKIPRPVTVTVALLLLTAYAAVARTQLSYWQNDGTLFQHAITVRPDYLSGQLTLAGYLEKNGRLEEAMTHYRAAIQLNSNSLPAHVNLGAVLGKTGNLAAAADEFREAVRIEPGTAQTHYNYGCLLYQLGRRDEAVAQVTEALRLKPDFALAQQALQMMENAASGRP